MGIICDYIILILILESKLASGQNFYLMRYVGQRLELTYSTTEAASPIHCNALCKREPNCRSNNYNTLTGECQTSEICYADVVGNTVTDPDWDVYTLTACQVPEPITGVHIPGGETSYGSSLTFECDTGYQPENSALSTTTITCLASASWSTPDAAFNCIRVCGEPPQHLNSHVSPGYITVDSQRQYQCDEQYVLTAASDLSSMTVTCQASGSWTSTNFQCVIDCGAPDVITGVHSSNGETSYESSLTIQCDAGYQPENSAVSTATITCLESGSWSTPDAAFHCLRVYEEPPQQPNSIVLPGDCTVDSQRQYQCFEGYVLTIASDTSTMTVTCQASGFWTSTSFQCVIDCGLPPAMTNGAWSGTTSEGSVVSYTCDARYSPSPDGVDTTILCQGSGAWTPPLISCEVASIGLSCSSDSDCLEVNSRCVYNNRDTNPWWRCLCNYKTEYNAASRSCDTQCTTYSNTFTKYPGIYILWNDHVLYYNKTKDECLQACIDYGETCASVDYMLVYGKCFIGKVSYQQIADGDWHRIVHYHHYDMYNRDCFN